MNNLINGEDYEVLFERGHVTYDGCRYFLAKNKAGLMLLEEVPEDQANFDFIELPRDEKLYHCNQDDLEEINPDPLRLYELVPENRAEYQIVRNIFGA